MDDKMNRQLTCELSIKDTPSVLATELVHYGFINKDDRNMVEVLIQDTLSRSHIPGIPSPGATPISIGAAWPLFETSSCLLAIAPSNVDSEDDDSWSCVCECVPVLLCVCVCLSEELPVFLRMATHGIDDGLHMHWHWHWHWCRLHPVALWDRGTTAVIEVEVQDCSLCELLLSLLLSPLLFFLGGSGRSKLGPSSHALYRSLYMRDVEHGALIELCVGGM